MKIVESGTMIYIYTPYNPVFVSELKGSVKCRWDAALRCWVTQKSMTDTVRKIMTDVYGYNDLDENQTRYAVKCRAKDLISAERGPVVLLGKVVASAWSRDGGAEAGDDVEFTKGRPESGGSVKNWATVICRNSEFIIHGVVKAKLDADSDLIDILSCTEEGNAPTASEQESEKNRLEQKRIALMEDVERIDSELKKLEQDQNHHMDHSLTDHEYFELRKQKTAECLRQIQDEVFRKDIARMDERLNKDLKKLDENPEVRDLFVCYMGMKELAGLYADSGKDDLWSRRHKMYRDQLIRLERELECAGYGYRESAAIFCSFRGALKIEECVALNTYNRVIERADAVLKDNDEM